MVPLHHPSSHVRRLLGAVALLTASCELWKSTWWFAVFFFGRIIFNLGDYATLACIGIVKLCHYGNPVLWIINQDLIGTVFLWLLCKLFFFGLAARLPCCSEKLPSLIIIIVTLCLHDLFWTKICLKQFSFFWFHGPITVFFSVQLLPLAAEEFRGAKKNWTPKCLFALPEVTGRPPSSVPLWGHFPFVTGGSAWSISLGGAWVLCFEPHKGPFHGCLCSRSMSKTSHWLGTFTRNLCQM